MSFTVKHLGVDVHCETVDDVLKLTTAIQTVKPPISAPVQRAPAKHSSFWPERFAGGGPAISHSDIREASKVLSVVRQHAPCSVMSDVVIAALSVAPRGLGSALLRANRAIAGVGFSHANVYTHTRTNKGREFVAGPDLEECFDRIHTLLDV